MVERSNDDSRYFGSFQRLETKHLALPLALNNSVLRAVGEIEIQQQLKRYASDAVQGLIRELGHVAKEEFEKWSNIIRERLVTEGLPCQPDQGLREALAISTSVTLPVGEFRQKFSDDTIALSRKLAIDVSQHVLKSVVIRSKEIKSDFDKTSRHSAEGELFQNERELREGCRREVTSAVELYASLIDLYVAGINTAGTMLLIQKAKLGRDIDFLQRERIDDDEKRETTEKLLQELFGQEHSKLSGIEQRCRLIPQEMKSLGAEALALAGQLEAIGAGLAAEKLNLQSGVITSIWDEALRPLIEQYELWQEQECEKLVATLVTRHHEVAERFEVQKGRVISAWKKRLFWIAIFGMVTITIVLSVYYRFGVSSEQQSLSEMVVWGAAGNALWAFAVFLYEKASATRKDWIATSRVAFFKNETPSITSEILFWPLETPPVLSDLKETCRGRLTERIQSLVSTSEQQFRNEFQSLADEIELVREKGLNVVNGYRRAWDSARQIIEGLYLETGEKIARFKTISAAFKERTIDRTRTLFGERADEFAKYISRLEASASELQKTP